MRILYDHQVFSLQNAGGASRYYYELMRSFAGASEVHTELWLGINDTVFPFRQLSQAQAHIVSWGGFLKRGSSRYIANEVLSNTLAPFAAACRWFGRVGSWPPITTASTNASPTFFRT
jgi:hypothetical protein